MTLIHAADIRVFSKRMIQDEYAVISDRKEKALLVFDNLSGEFMGSQEMGDDTAVSLN